MKNVKFEVFTPNMKSAIFMVLAMAGYSFNDAFAKLAAQELELYQIIFMRGVFVTIFILIIIWWRKPNRQKKDGKHSYKKLISRPVLPLLIIRIVGEIGATITFLAALFQMPIANVTAIIQLVPLVITAGAAVVFKETIGPWRMSAIAVGFIGVILIVQPGTNDFNSFSIYAMGAVICISIRDMATHRLPHDIPSMDVAFITSINVLILGAVGAMFQPWYQMDLPTVIYLMMASLTLTGGYIFSVMTMRMGEISFSSPFRYTIILWAMLTGYFVWAEIPNFWETIGALLIIAGGLIALHREKNSE